MEYGCAAVHGAGKGSRSPHGALGNAAARGGGGVGGGGGGVVGRRPELL